jgi:hypothetical protein
MGALEGQLRAEHEAWRALASSAMDRLADLQVFYRESEWGSNAYP